MIISSVSRRGWSRFTRVTAEHTPSGSCSRSSTPQSWAFLLASFRNHSGPSTRDQVIGFRCARTRWA